MLIYCSSSKTHKRCRRSHKFKADPTSWPTYEASPSLLAQGPETTNLSKQLPRRLRNGPQAAFSGQKTNEMDKKCFASRFFSMIETSPPSFFPPSILSDLSILGFLRLIFPPFSSVSVYFNKVHWCTDNFFLIHTLFSRAQVWHCYLRSLTNHRLHDSPTPKISVSVSNMYTRTAFAVVFAALASFAAAAPLNINLGAYSPAL